jgi:3-methyladenine DNA glycosylase/8-oxoguanine DNA glycosylase
VSRIEQHFGGHLPSPAELLAADPHVLRASGMSTRKGESLRAFAERFVDGRLSDEAL